MLFLVNGGGEDLAVCCVLHVVPPSYYAQASKQQSLEREANSGDDDFCYQKFRIIHSSCLLTTENTREIKRRCFHWQLFLPPKAGHIYQLYAFLCVSLLLLTLSTSNSFQRASNITFMLSVLLQRERELVEPLPFLLHTLCRGIFILEQWGLPRNGSTNGRLKN